MNLFDEITGKNKNQNQNQVQTKKRDDEEFQSSMSLFDEITGSKNQQTQSTTESPSFNSIFEEITSQKVSTDVSFDTTQKDVGSTVGYTAGKVGTGGLSVVEGVADTGAWLLKQAGKLTSWLMDNPVGRFLFGEYAGDYEANPLYQIGDSMIQGEVAGTFDQILDESEMAQRSYVEPGSLGANVASGVGQVGGMILTGKMIPGGKIGTLPQNATKAQKVLNTANNIVNKINPTTKTMFASTFGNSYSQASNSGADEFEATTFGLLNATKETATEMMYGGLGKAFGKGALDDVIKENVTNMIKSKIGKKIAEIGIAMTAEGLEEVASGLLQPFVDSVYTHELDFSSYNSLLDDFIAGALVSGVFQTGSNIMDLKRQTPESVATKIQEKNLQEKLETITKDTEKIITNDKIDSSIKVDRINSQIDILNDQLNTDVQVGTLNIEEIYKQKQELIKKRDELTEKMTEQQKTKVIKSLSSQVNEVFNAPEETIDSAVIEATADKVQQIEKLTNEVEKDKKIKIISNKQKVEVNSKTYVNEAAAIIEQMNINIPEGQKHVEIVTELNQEQHQIMDLGSLFGKQVIFTNNMPQSGLVSQNNPNILFIDTKASSQLSTNKQTTTLYVLGHELYHSLKQTNAETYNQFTDYVKQEVTIDQIVDFVQKYDTENANQILDSLKINGEFDLNNVRKHYLKYKTQNQILNYIVEEMTANEFGGMMTDSNYMNTLAENNKSLFDKIVDSIRELFKSLTGSNYDSSLTQLQVEKIRTDFENIVNKINTKEKSKTKKEIKTETKVETPKPDVKTTQLDNETWFKSIEKNYQRYLDTQNDDILTTATRAYENYKNKGGTSSIAELDNLIDNKSKNDFKNKLKEAGLNVKELPKTGDTTQKESQFYTNTVTNSPIFKSIFDDLSKNKDFRFYSATTHKQDFNKAIERIRERGDAAITDFLGNTKTFDSVDSAMAKILIEYYQKTGDVQSEIVVATKVREAITRGAQVVESAKIFRNLSPASMILQVESDLSRAYEELQNSTDRDVTAWFRQNGDNLRLTDAEKDWLYQNFNSLSKMDPESFEYKRKYAVIQSFISSKIPKSMTTKVKNFRRMSMLLNPKTMTRNVMGNVVILPVNVVADKLGSYVDKYISKTSGVRTTGSVNFKESFKGVKEGIRQSTEDYRLNINTDSANQFEIQQGSTWLDSDLKGAGKILNELERFMNYGLNLGDRPFSEAYYYNSLSNQMKLNGVTEATETMKQIAREEANKKTWKNDGRAVQLASKARQLFNFIGFRDGKLTVRGDANTDLGLGDIIMPFIMTPSNLAVAIYDYSPAAFISVYQNSKSFKNAVKTGKNVEVAQKKLVDSFGKASAGVILYAIAYVLAKAGVISGGEDEDKDIRALMRAQGYQPYSIKIGNKTYSYDWAQPLANPFATMAELNRQTVMNKNNPNKSNEANNMFKAVSEAFTIGADRLYEQSFLQTLKNIFSAESPQDAVVTFAGDLPASFVPTLLKQIADITDGNAKATYDKNNLLTSMLARTAVKIPGLKSSLPTKRDVLGNEIKLYGGDNDIFNVMFNPAIVSSDVAGDVGKELMDVYTHTGEAQIMPQVAVTYVDYDSNNDGIKERITFNTEQQAIIQQYMGQLSAKTVNELLNNSVYVNASYDDKAVALISLMQYTKAVALRDSGLIPNYEIKGGNALQIDKYVTEGLTIPEAVMYDSLINTIKGLKDENGDSIKGSQNGQKAYQIMNMQISDFSKNIMLELISPTATTPETVDSLSMLSSVDQYIDYYSLPRRDSFIIDRYSRDDYDISTSYFNIDGRTYTEFAQGVSDIKSDYNAKGEPIPNSKKNKTFQYINQLPLNQYQKLYLFAISGYSIKPWKNQMFAYINNMNISADEKKVIWKELGLD